MPYGREWFNRYLCGPGQEEVECSALICFAFHPNPSAMAMDDPLDYSQANAGSGKIHFVVQALEHAEKPIGVLHVKTYAVVAHAIDGSGFSADLPPSCVMGVSPEWRPFPTV